MMKKYFHIVCLLFLSCCGSKHYMINDIDTMDIDVGMDCMVLKHENAKNKALLKFKNELPHEIMEKTNFKEVNLLEEPSENSIRDFFEIRDNVKLIDISQCKNFFSHRYVFIISDLYLDEHFGIDLTPNIDITLKTKDRLFGYTQKIRCDYGIWDKNRNEYIQYGKINEKIEPDLFLKKSMARLFVDEIFKGSLAKN